MLTVTGETDSERVAGCVPLVGSYSYQMLDGDVVVLVDGATLYVNQVAKGHTFKTRVWTIELK